MQGGGNKNRGPETFTGFWINRASRLMVRRTDARLRHLGFAMSYLPVLRALASGTATTQKELALAAGVEQPSMAETLTRMERDGLIERKTNPDDKRGAVISVTRRARAIFPEAVAGLNTGEQELVAGLSLVEQAHLRELLQRVVKNLEEAPETSEEPSKPTKPRKRRNS